jgi:hypothetical protein
VERSGPSPVPGPAGVPSSWDRRYGRWARRAVRDPADTPPAPGDRDGDGIAEAALLAVRVVVLSALAGLGAALLFGLGPAAGFIGLILATALCWWWMVGAMAFIDRR